MMIKKCLNSKKLNKVESKEAYEYIVEYPLRYQPMNEQILRKITCYGVKVEDVSARILNWSVENFKSPEYIYIPKQFYFTNSGNYEKTGMFAIDSLTYIPFMEGESFFMMVVIADTKSGTRQDSDWERVYSSSRYVYKIDYNESLVYCPSYEVACGVLMSRFLVSLPGGKGAMRNEQD